MKRSLVVVLAVVVAGGVGLLATLPRGGQREPARPAKPPADSGDAERKAVAELRKLGAEFERDGAAAGKPVLKLRLVGPVEDAMLAPVPGCITCRGSCCRGTRVTDRGARALEGPENASKS